MALHGANSSSASSVANMSRMPAYQRAVAARKALYGNKHSMADGMSSL